MALVNSSIPNLINGVSQQPYALRLSSQADVQVNALSSVVEGLRKRPPTRFEFMVGGTDFAERKVLVHQINRDTSERYQVLITDKGIKVYDLITKAEVPVTFKDGSRSYLNCNTPATQLRALTVADYTFVLNRTLIVRADDEVVPAYRPDAIIWVRQGAYGAKYQITLDNTTVAWRTPQRETDNTAYEDDEQNTVPAPTGYVAQPPRFIPKKLTGQYVATDTIAEELFDLLRLNPTLQEKFTFSRIGSIIRVRTKGVQRNDPINGSIITYPDFTVRVTDSQGDTVLLAFKDRVQNFTDLPKNCFNGFRIKIMGDGATQFDDYYVRFEGSFTGGTWVEDIADLEKFKLDPSTMPHALIRQANGSFSFEAIPWEPRKVGDSKSVPLPSFVNKRIRDLFFYRNRLGFAAQEQVVMSRFGEFFNFFRASATQVLDTDVIDVAVSHTKVSDINHAIAYNETLLLFAQETQFQIGNTDALTPKTISFSQTTEFPCSARVKPVGSGPYVYFAFDRGRFSGVREYYVEAENATKDATDITSHVPKYIPGDITFMEVSKNEDILLVLSDQEGKQHQMYVYKYYWAGEEKLQSSWSVWEFDPEVNILSAQFVDSTLWLTMLRDGRITMESMDLAPAAVDSGVDWQIHLDRRLDETTAPPSQRNDPLNGEQITTIPLPYPYVPGMKLIAKQGNPDRFNSNSNIADLDDAFVEGEDVLYEAEVDNRGNWRLQVKGNLQRYWLGVPYTMTYKFSTLTMKQPAEGGGMKSVVDGRLQLRNMSLQYANSGYFRVNVDLSGPDRSYNYLMTAKYTGLIGTRVNRLRVDTGTIQFPLLGRNTLTQITVINDNFMPSAILSAEWEGNYVTQSRRV